MMEKPLHVRVAEALGATNVRSVEHVPGWYADWPSGNPHQHHDQCCSDCDAHLIANYDTDWSATGPLIKRYGVSLNQFVCVEECCPPDGVRWTAVYGSLGIEFPDATAEAHSPLQAVCNLILALKASGKLET